MDPRLSGLLQKTSLYGTLAKYYEHMDPEKHIYFYKKHLKYERKLVDLYWSLHPTTHQTTIDYLNVSI